MLSHLSRHVAETTALGLPNEATTIWNRLARREINRTGRRSYENALVYLRPMQKSLRPSYPCGFSVVPVHSGDTATSPNETSVLPEC